MRLIQSPRSQVSWTARDGFICSLALVLSSFALNRALHTAYAGSAGFANWVRANSYFAESMFVSLRACLWLGLAYWVTRNRSLKTFLHQAGFDLRPGLPGWFLAWAALGFGILVLQCVKMGFGQAHDPASAYARGGGFHWEFFVIYTVLLTQRWKSC